MLTKLIALGFTSDQGEKAIADLGIETEDDLKHLTEDDLTNLGIKPIPARRILAAVGAPPSREITVSLNNGDKSVLEIYDPEELLAILASERSVTDKKNAARKIRAMDRKVVVNKNNPRELLFDETLVYWKIGNRESSFWGVDHHRVVPVNELFEDEMVEIDPFELANNRRLVALNNGYNADSGANWAGVTMSRRALLIAAALDGEVVARGDSVGIATALSAEQLIGKWSILEARANKGHLEDIERNLRVPLSAIQTPESNGWNAVIVAIFNRGPSPSPGGSSYGGGAGSGKPRGVEFREYLLRGFSVEAMILFDYEIKPLLPVGSVSQAQMAAAFVECAEQTGKVLDPAFWTELIRVRPRHILDIRALAAMYGVNL